jgi:hypothetical protein
MNNLKLNVRRFILDWNKKFPIDLWWRMKYNIPFGSPKHREISFIDQLIDYEESKMLEEREKPKPKSEDLEYEKFGISQETLDEEFDKLDLENLNDNLIE